MIGRNGERRSGMSAQAARHDDENIKTNRLQIDMSMNENVENSSSDRKMGEGLKKWM